MESEWMRRGYSQEGGSIGQGSFGKVFKAIKKNDAKKYAIKMIQNINPFMLDDIQKEIKAMETVRSRNTLSAIDHFYDQNECQYCIVTEYIQGGDLTQYLKQPWNEVDIVSFILQITQAFLELMKNGIIHRDLKPANILVVRQGQYMVCDFGCAKFLDNNQSQFLKISKNFGTQLYMAPQVFISAPYNVTVDIWSMGVICYQLVYDKLPMRLDSFGQVPSYEHMLHLIEGVQEIQYPKTERVSKQVVNLIQKMLCINAKERIKWPQIRQYLMDHFDYTIEKIDHVLNTKKFVGKLQQTAVHLILQCKDLAVLDKQLKRLRNSIIIAQSEELVQADQLLSKGMRLPNTVISNVALDEFATSPALKQFRQARDKNLEYKNKVFKKDINQTLKQAVNEIISSSKILLPQVKKIVESRGATDKSMHALLEILVLMSQYYESFRPRKTNNFQAQYRAIKSQVIH